uniref:Uncharacterized protein n=1 Tax=Ditylenchus dipsaci TaxID=166011 RepID=A0A915CR86_9BILA
MQAAKPTLEDRIDAEFQPMREERIMGEERNWRSNQRAELPMGKAGSNEVAGRSDTEVMEVEEEPLFKKGSTMTTTCNNTLFDISILLLYTSALNFYASAEPVFVRIHGTINHRPQFVKSKPNSFPTLEASWLSKFVRKPAKPVQGISLKHKYEKIK